MLRCKIRSYMFNSCKMKHFHRGRKCLLFGALCTPSLSIAVNEKREWYYMILSCGPLPFRQPPTGLQYCHAHLIHFNIAMESWWHDLIENWIFSCFAKLKNFLVLQRWPRTQQGGRFAQISWYLKQFSAWAAGCPGKFQIIGSPLYSM